MPLITALVYASQTLTSDGTNVTADDTVTVGSQTYTFKASVGSTANQVLVGADAAASLTNLKAAINADAAGAGTLFGSATVAHTNVVATTLTSTTLKVVSKVPGTIGNHVPSTETSTHLSWGDETLAGGTGSIATAISEILDGRLQLTSAVEQALRELDGDASAD